MPDPFATALAALVAAPGSVAAIYDGGSPVWIRVIRHQPSEIVPLGMSHVVLDGSTLVIRRADVPQPLKGDQIMIGDEALTVLADPVLDAEGVSWTVQAA